MKKKITKGSVVVNRYGQTFEVMMVEGNSVYLYGYSGTVHISKLFLV